MTNLASQANCILCRWSYQVIVSVSFLLIKAFTFFELIFFPSLVDVLNLVLYPDRHSDQTNAGARHKALLSLKGFSGLQVLNKMDKHFNVIVIITTEEVIPLSFETIDQRADWLALLQGHFGKGEFKKKERKIYIKDRIRNWLPSKRKRNNLYFYNPWHALRHETKTMLLNINASLIFLKSVVSLLGDPNFF